MDIGDAALAGVAAVVDLAEVPCDSAEHVVASCTCASAADSRWLAVVAAVHRRNPAVVGIADRIAVDHYTQEVGKQVHEQLARVCQIKAYLHAVVVAGSHAAASNTVAAVRACEQVVDCGMAAAPAATSVTQCQSQI